MYLMYNLLSLLLGLAAWILGAVGWRTGCRGWNLGSWCSCALALFFQIVGGNRQVQAGDWSALLDTWDAVTFVSTVLVGVTAAITLGALLRKKRR